MTRTELNERLLSASSDAERDLVLRQLRALGAIEELLPRLRKMAGAGPETSIIVTQGDMRVTGHSDGRVTVCLVGSEEDNG